MGNSVHENIKNAKVLHGKGKRMRRSKGKILMKEINTNKIRIKNGKARLYKIKMIGQS